MVLMPGFQSTRLVTEGALEPFFFLYTDDSIQGNPETCKQSSIMLNYEVKNTLKRILPQRSVPGSGFHVTRKTFSTHKLQRGIPPERISSAIGQRSVKSLTPYLSLDGERLSMCPLSLESLNIPWKGGLL